MSEGVGDRLRGQMEAAPLLGSDEGLNVGVWTTNCVLTADSTSARHAAKAFTIHFNVSLFKHLLKPN